MDGLDRLRKHHYVWFETKHFVILRWYSTRCESKLKRFISHFPYEIKWKSYFDKD